MIRKLSQPRSVPSIRRTLTLRLFAAILPLMVVLVLANWMIERALLFGLFDEALLGRAESIATLVTQKGGQVELEFADEFTPQYSGRDARHYFQVWLDDGTVLERSLSLRNADLPLEVGEIASPSFFTCQLGSGAEVRCVGVSFPPRAQAAEHEVGYSGVSIVVAADTSLLHKTLKRGYLQVAMTGALSFVAILIAVFIVIRRGMRIVARISEQVDQITPDILSEPLDAGQAPLEVRPIVHSLNRSMRMIRQVVEREHRFNLDVSHELRTPIAELRSAAEVALKWPDQAALDELAAEVRDVAVDMGATVEGLLELSGIESGGLNLDSTRFDLAPHLLLHIEDMEKGKGGCSSFSLAVPEELSIVGSPVLWNLVFRNVLDNACKYSVGSALIDVSLSQEGEGAVFRVANSAECSNGELATRSLERLWRGRGKQAPQGAGLGLSIVQAAAIRMKHRVEVEVSQGRFILTVRPNSA